MSIDDNRLAEWPVECNSSSLASGTGARQGLSGLAWTRAMGALI
jgi:hypothetical protein